MQELQDHTKECDTINNLDKSDEEIQRLRLICDVSMFYRITDELRLENDEITLIKNSKHY